MKYIPKHMMMSQSLSFNFLVPFYPQVAGEGEITSIIFPDGSIQLYFIPKFLHDWTPYQYMANNIANKNSFIKPSNTEYWFVRSANFPSTTRFDALSHNIYGNSLLNQPSPNYCMNVPNYTTDYYQKFHSDNTTSTTDITYFYPNLRQSTRPQNSALIQTSLPASSHNFLNNANGLCKNPCNCKVSFKIKDSNSEEDCVCKESRSSMSVDDVINTSKHSSKKKKHKKSRHNRRNVDHLCSCRNKAKTDKIVTTYIDQACGNVRTDGRQTQTMQRTQQSDIKTEIWVPIKKKSRKSNSSINTDPGCVSRCYSNDCTCDSTTETDGR